jgi:hypothetical protein
MRHCTPDELMDVAEGVRPEASLPHLTACALCRSQWMELRTVLAELREVPVPEPSPTQWVRLSARVREAIASEVERSQSPWWAKATGWAWLLPIAAAAVLTLAVVLPWRDRSEPAMAPSATTMSATLGSVAPAVNAMDIAGDTADDPSFGLMFDLAGVIDLDADPVPVLAMGEGTLDRAVGDLSLDEQHELARLLKEAMERPGV